jgi:glycerophosphoryl diester phosphodiesterase
MFSFVALIALLLAPALVLAQDRSAAAPPRSGLHRLQVPSPADLRELMRYTGQPLPLVSAHRGGATAGFPENCIATFEHTLRHTYALLEVDPRYTKDGQIVLHHDPRLERTTTGNGLLTEHTLAQVKELRLKDPAGNTTNFQVPTLDEALQWARGKAVLVLDQKDVPVAARVKKIEEHQAEAFAMLIVYSFAEAKACYELNENVMMEVMVPSREKLSDFDKLGVPWQNVIAFVGHIPPEDAELYAAIHGKGACCLIGTSRNLDRQILTRQATDIAKLESGYRSFLARGADVIETDIPAQLGPLLYGATAPSPAKAKYFLSP